MKGVRDRNDGGDRTCPLLFIFLCGNALFINFWRMLMKNDLRQSDAVARLRAGKGFIPFMEDARRMLLCDSVGMSLFRA